MKKNIKQRSQSTVSITGVIITLAIAVLLLFVVMPYSSVYVDSSDVILFKTSSDDEFGTIISYKNSNEVKSGQNINIDTEESTFNGLHIVEGKYILELNMSGVGSFSFKSEDELGELGFSFGVRYNSSLSIYEFFLSSLLADGSNADIYVKNVTNFDGNSMVDALYFTCDPRSRSGFFSHDSSRYPHNRVEFGYEGSLSHKLYSFESDSDTSDAFIVFMTCLLYGKYGGRVALSGVTSANEIIDYKLRLPDPEKQGYKFTGWFLDEACTKAYQGEILVNGDINLYACWEKIYFTITFYVDNAVWKQMEVEYASTLSFTFSSAGINQVNVIGYENLNTSTQAVSIEDFVVLDDMAVYLSADIDTSSSAMNDNSTSSLNAWQSFVKNVKAFFKSIGDWFKNLFKKIKR